MYSVKLSAATCTAIVTLLVIMSATAPLAVAQLEAVEFQGTLIGLDARAVRIRTDKGDVVFAGIDPLRLLADGVTRQGGIPEPQVVVRAISTVDYVRPGMSLRFSAKLDGRKKLHDEVDHFTVIAPSRDTIFGFVPVEVAADAKAVDAPEPKKGAPRMHTITGQVVDIRRGSLTMRVPDDDRIEELKVRLSPDVVVELAVPDLTLAKAGDLVLAKGFGAGGPGFFATEVTITGAGVEDKAQPDPAKVAGPAKPLRDGPLLPPVAAEKGADDKGVADKPAKGEARNLILKIN